MNIVILGDVGKIPPKILHLIYMDIIGHRGAKGLAPENTLAGVRFALRRNVDWIEFDVRATKDGELVVLHDRTLLRIAKQSRPVSSFTYAELSQIATVSGEAIPTFQEVMDVIGRKAKIMIELKSKHTAKKVVAEIKQQVAGGRAYSDFMVSSFRPWLLRDAQRHDKKVPLLLLHAAWPFAFVWTRALKLSGVGFWHTFTPKLAIAAAKKRQLYVAVYTVNSTIRYNHFQRLGVDGVITDIPQAFRSLWPYVLKRLALVTLALGICYVVWHLF